MSGVFSQLAGYGNVQLFPVWVTHCSTVGAGSVKEQGFTASVSVDTDRGKWTVPAPLFSRKGREHEGWSSCLSSNIFLLISNYGFGNNATVLRQD